MFYSKIKDMSLYYKKVDFFVKPDNQEDTWKDWIFQKKQHTTQWRHPFT